ncbi:hypothetical protein AM5_029 [Lactococcus phage AM5]|uniref:Uncharacterized protein n=1 Tax=Lactococcus phage AM5 TaxID=1965473 RepID=A0A1W6JKY7_9CAUD|nr:hypothetical protein AM5_029 [Lactococcus phage AM5]
MKLIKAFLISISIVLSIVALISILAMIHYFLGFIWFLVADAVMMIVVYTYLIYSSMRDKEKLEKELMEKRK